MKNRALQENNHKFGKLAIFGHFSGINLGNDATFQALLYHVRRHLPDLEVTCICTDPGTTAKLYNLGTVPMNGMCVERQLPGSNLIGRVLRKLIVGIPAELYRWWQAQRALKGTDAVIVAGTGLLTDVCGLRNWGPYTVFKWSLVAKMRGCELLFVSVGAGPLYRRTARLLIKSALALGDIRTYRDWETKQFLRSIGFHAESDEVYPDLAFSFPQHRITTQTRQQSSRRVVGLGLMLYAGKISIDKPSEVIYGEYLSSLVLFVDWLLMHDYDVRLLIGDSCDRPVIEEFKSRLYESGVSYEHRVIAEPVVSVDNLLAQITTTDVVVATRFHNVLLALVLNKPVVSISFHQKCTSLMNDMGLSAYCQDIKTLQADWLISQFCELEKNRNEVKALIQQRAKQFREALDKQYAQIFRQMDAHAESICRRLTPSGSLQSERSLGGNAPTASGDGEGVSAV